MIAVSELDSDFDLAWLGSTWTGLGRDSTRLDLIGVRWSLRHLRGAHYTALYTCPCTYLMARALCAACMKTSGTIPFTARHCRLVRGGWAAQIGFVG